MQIVLRDQVKRIVSAVIFAKDFIASAVSTDPHLSLAWAGVSLFLPLLSNPTAQESDLLDGIDLISSIVCRFMATEQIYRESCLTAKSTAIETSRLDLQCNFEKAVVSLYAGIIEFQARAACQAVNNAVLRTIEDIVKHNDWGSLQKTIQVEESKCVEYMQIIDQHTYYSAIQRTSKQLNAIKQSSILLQDIVIETLTGVKTHRQEAKQRHENEAEVKCLQALYTTNYESQKRLPDPVSGTCQWLTGHSYYQRWKVKPTSDVLWISADPGCGKSVLAKYLIETELRTRNERTTCYFFFKDESEERRSSTHAICAIRTRSGSLLKSRKKLTS